MIKPRRELCLAHEAPLPNATPLVQHLDDGLATEERLIREVNGTEATFVEFRAEQELTEHPTAVIFALFHRGKR
jgi:hypothetical protein